MSTATLSEAEQVKIYAAATVVELQQWLDEREALERTYAAIKSGSVTRAFNLRLIRAIKEALSTRQAATLPVRRGARVLYAYSNGVGVGHVEGESFCGSEAWFVFRHQDGSVGYCPQGLARLVTVDAGTVLVEDQFNNVGRLCNVRGDGAAGYPNRCWIVAAAVSGSRYLVRHLDYDTVALVGHRDMTNLY